MLRELNENEMEMVSGGTEDEPIDEVVSTGTRRTNSGVTREYLNSIGMSIGEYLYGSSYNVSPALLESLGDWVPEGISGSEITLPDPEPTVDTTDPTAPQTVDIHAITIGLGDGLSVSVGTVGDTVAVNVTQTF